MSGKEFYVRYYVGHKGKFGEVLFSHRPRHLTLSRGLLALC